MAATRETFGELMNIARRSERLGDKAGAASAAREALKVAEAHPELVCEGRPMPRPLREMATRLASLDQ